MPESFEGMLAELADAAASVTPLPDLALVRGRARERTVRHRLAVSALALTVLAAGGGTLAVVSAQHQPTAGVGPLGTAAASGPAPEQSPTPSGVASGDGATAVPNVGSLDTAPYTAAAGLWQSLVGGQELIVFPDGVLGIGESGQWAFCEARIKPVGDGLSFVVYDNGVCSGYDAAGMSLRVQGGKELTLAIPAAGKLRSTMVSYLRVGAGLGAATDAGAVVGKELIGSWVSKTGEIRDIRLFAGGYTQLEEFTTSGADGTVAGNVTGYYADAVRVEIPCTGGTTGSVSNCMVVELQYDGQGQMSAVGSAGAEFFGVSGTADAFKMGLPSSAQADPSGSASGLLDGSGPAVSATP